MTIFAAFDAFVGSKSADLFKPSRAAASTSCVIDSYTSTRKRSQLPMVLSLPRLEEGARRRLQRLCISAVFFLYARKTWRSFRENAAILQLQSEPMTRLGLFLSVLKYTAVGQLLAGAEPLIGLAKPMLGYRIGRNLLSKGENGLAGIVYGEHSRSSLDLYGIDRNASPRKPVIVFVHGGGWTYGHKWQYGLVGKYLAKHGFLVAVINYRTYPTGSVLEQCQDVQDAIHWMHANAATYGGDPTNLFLSGHSSGAHIGALTLIQSAIREKTGTVDPENPTSITRPPVYKRVKAFIGLSAPYDIADHYGFESARVVGPFDGVHEISAMKPAMLGLSRFDDFSPPRLIDKTKDLKLSLPPFHILHGNADDVVPPSSSQKLYASMQRAGLRAEYCELDGCSHENILFAAMGDNVPHKDEVVAHYKRIASSANSVASAAAVHARL